MYIGTHRIKSTEELDDGHIQVTFEDEEVMKYTLSPALLEATSTEEESDATQLREKRTEFFVKDFIASMLEHNMYYDEYQHIMTTLDETMNNHRKHAIDKLWGGQEYEHNVYECNNILTK